MIDEQGQADDLAAELVDLDRKIKQLRRTRAAITYDLEQSLKERDRLIRHLKPEDEREERHA